MKALVLLLLINQSSASDSRYRDKELKKKDAPAFLLAAVPGGSDVDNVEFFEKKI